LTLAKRSGSHWANYLLGVIRSLQLKNHAVKPFLCVVGGNIPVGAGLSSSAAFECGFVFGLNELNHLGLSRLDMAFVAQWAEHNYAGVLCGIMDQFASIMGKQGNVFVLDCRDLSFDYFPFQSPSYQLILMDTRVKHSLAGSEYNTRRKECETGVSLLQKHYPAVKSLRDVTLEMLKEYGSSMPDKVYNRCLYVVEENLRVQGASLDLKAGDLIGFGAKMFETHRGLSKLYEVSCDELDFLVDKASTMDGVIGSRMMGGGFGGCTISIVSDQVIDSFIDHSREAYLSKFGVAPIPYRVKISDGTSIL
jgi:galactokinase